MLRVKPVEYLIEEGVVAGGGKDASEDKDVSELSLT